MSRLLTAIGVTAILLFVGIYAVELFHHGGAPVTIRWIREHFGQGGLITINIAIVVAFLALLPYRRSTMSTWKSKGVFIAFVIALMTEMFGWPLLIFLLAPLVEIPSLREWAHTLLGHAGPMLGTWLSMIGVVLIAVGWSQIHRAEGLVTTGIYRYISAVHRHFSVHVRMDSALAVVDHTAFMAGSSGSVCVAGEAGGTSCERGVRRGVSCIRGENAAFCATAAFLKAVIRARNSEMVFFAKKF